MELVYIVISIALIEYVVFSLLVGKARQDYEVPAPATTGDPVFERYYRVQQNTLELLIYFVPGILIFSQYFRADVAAAIGLVFVIGRLFYLKEYIAEPKSRALGFLLSFIPAQILLIGGLVGAIMSLME